MTGTEFSQRNCTINQKPARQQPKEAAPTYTDPMTSWRDRIRSARYIKILGANKCCSHFINMCWVPAVCLWLCWAMGIWQRERYSPSHGTAKVFLDQRTLALNSVGQSILSFSHTITVQSIETLHHGHLFPPWTGSEEWQRQKQWASDK